MSKFMMILRRLNTFETWSSGVIARSEATRQSRRHLRLLRPNGLAMTVHLDSNDKIVLLVLKTTETGYAESGCYRVRALGAESYPRV